MWCLAALVLLLQGLKIHFHTFEDHEPVHGHTHAVEVHIGGLPTDSGHDDSSLRDVVVVKLGVMKFKLGLADCLAILFSVAVFVLVSPSRSGRTPWGTWRNLLPLRDGAVRIPPLRAPPH